jgi:putative flippase GtrA
MRSVVQEWLRYCAVSGCALFADVTILFILVHYFSWWYVAAASVSFCAGMLIGYTLSITFVFKFRRLRDWRLEFASFAAIGAVGLLINDAAISFAVSYLGIYYLVAKLGAAGGTFLWNYIARRQLLFVSRRPI